jgi:hypothetical protein
MCQKNDIAVGYTYSEEGERENRESEKEGEREPKNVRFLEGMVPQFYYDIYIYIYIVVELRYNEYLSAIYNEYLRVPIFVGFSSKRKIFYKPCTYI